jgi:hypothetical protein
VTSERRTRRARAALGALLLSLGLSCGGEQPPPFCTISRATYAARYTLVSGEGACAELKGEVLGGQAYVPDPSRKGDHGSLAIQSEALGKRIQAGAKMMPPVVDLNEEHKPFAHGGFTNRLPDGNNVCSVPRLSEARLEQGAVMMEMEMLPAIDVTYKFSNVKSYVAASQIGVLFGGDLEYTLAGCTAKYKVMAISPLVSCADKDGKPDAHLCDAIPDPASGFAGSGLNPDIEVACDPDLLLCVPAKSFPSLKRK